MQQGAILYVWKQLSPSVEYQLALGPAFGMTDTGTVRPSNEDNFLIDPSLGLLAVADGMGGHAAGEVASANALTILAEFIRARATLDSGRAAPAFTPAFDDLLNGPDTWADTSHAAMVTLHEAVEFANQSMYQTNIDNLHDEGGGMGTTLTGLWQPEPDGPALVFHVGDTRLYRLRQGQLVQLTRDQTMYQKALESGVRHNLPPRNLLLQALGPSSGIKPELQTRPVTPGDLFLLCSDGLHGAIADAQIGQVLGQARQDDLGASCAQLIELAKQNGSRDNITVVLFQCKH
jgi:serine/threonine protein phosphatase PrpC